MPDPEAQPPEPPLAPDAERPLEAAAPTPATPAYLPYAAYPSALGAPAAPEWTKAYEHPTARRVVSTGLQLAVEANRDIRRASIYIGLLALGAFGPAVLLLLIGIARLLSDPSMAEIIANDPSLVFLEQPEIAGPLLLIYVLLIAGGVLLIGISVDAQAMAISMLGGRASDQPVRLWEAITRARQVFWRLLAADAMVGVVSVVVSLVISIIFFRPLDSNAGVSFIGSMIGTLVVTPFAFSAAGVVLGDVGPTEALRRSMALFRARPRISLVVTLFTLVTSAIQSFAISAGADAAVRVGGILHLGLDQGPLPLVITVLIVLAFIVAFGSLTFTIAAIVAAPQVSGFLGLTYYSGGLDKARSRDGARPRRFRWVSVPMLLAMAAVIVVAAIGLPSVVGFEPRAASPIIQVIRSASTVAGRTVFPTGIPNTVEDPVDDGIGARSPSIDVVSASYAYLPDVPDWLLEALFDCESSNVACGDPATSVDVFQSGAYLFLQRMAGPPGVLDDTERAQWGPLLALDGQRVAGYDADEPLSGATHAFITRMDAGVPSLHLLIAVDTHFEEVHTNARSAWIDNDLLTLVPVRLDLKTDIVRWDVTAQVGFRGGHDALRATSLAPLRPAQAIPYTIHILDMFGFESFEP